MPYDMCLDLIRQNLQSLEGFGTFGGDQEYNCKEYIRNRDKEWTGAYVKGTEQED